MLTAKTSLYKKTLEFTVYILCRIKTCKALKQLLSRQQNITCQKKFVTLLHHLNTSELKLKTLMWQKLLKAQDSINRYPILHSFTSLSPTPLISL